MTAVRVVAAIAVAAGVAVAAAPASARKDPVRVVQVSGANPLPECTTWPTTDAELAAMRDWDVEPSLAVSPRDPDHLLAAWMTGYSDGIAVGRSDDGGATWSVRGVRIVDCAAYHSTFDPSLAAGTDVDGAGEVAYLVTDTAGPGSGTTGVNHDTGVVALTSYDGGLTWGAPVALDHAGDIDAIDGSHVAADPWHPGTAYALWSKVNVLTFGRDEYVSRTTDGGRHWSAPEKLPSLVAAMPIGTRLVVGPGGSLAAVSASAPQAQVKKVAEIALANQDVVAAPHPTTVGPTELVVTTAAYGGAWTPRRTIASVDDERFTDIGVGADAAGHVVAAWMRVAGDTVRPYVVTSDDGGRAWSPERPAGDAVTSAPFLAGSDIVAPPTVTVDRTGAPSVFFYDHRDGATRVWVRRPSLTGWTEQLAYGPFDGTSGPAGDGSFCDAPPCTAQSFLGDYFGGAALPSGAAMLTVATNPLPGSPHNTDVYLVRVGS